MFASANAELKAVTLRPEFRLEKIPAPRRIAPEAAAYALQILLPTHEEPLATGRLVLLYDHSEPPEWGTPWRVVIFGQAHQDPDIGMDPLLPSVGWSWLLDALAEHDVTAGQLGGTVTRTLSEGFGTLAHADEEEPAVALELRASWSPNDHHAGAHLKVLADVLSRMAGLPPRSGKVADLNEHR